MKLYHRTLFFFFTLFLLTLLIYSYVLVDLNLTLFNDDLWLLFRERLIQIGYYQRELSTYFFVFFIGVSFFFHMMFTKKYKEFSLWTVVLGFGILGVLSYPLLSHDFFNYMFDAKIVTFYHQNPYIMKALSYPDDPWIRFMHWIHRTYPYGPVFLPITLIPSFLSFGKFTIGLYLFKATSVFFYVLGVWVTEKLNKKWAFFFATHPLVIFEGLINGHNDLIGVSLALVGIYHLFKNKKILPRVFFLLSLGIKYITGSFILLSKNKKHVLNKLAFGLTVVVLLYLSLKQEIQPWYFLALLPFVVYFEEFFYKLNLFFSGLLLSYIPYVRFGEWDAVWKINLKHQIILGFLVANIIYLLATLPKKKFFKR